MGALTIAVVTTANASIGTGHFRRCLTLAEALGEAGHKVKLRVYAGDPALNAWLMSSVNDAVIDPALTLDKSLVEARDADIIIVDSYDVTVEHLAPLYDRGHRVLVIDDLADRYLPATWLLNSCVDDPALYDKLTDGQLLLGPTYALLRSQFSKLPLRSTSVAIQRVLVSFGGSDVLGLASRALGWLEHAGENLQVRVVAGPLAHASSFSSHCHDVDVLREVKNMAYHMQWADIAITAAGQTSFELAATGCPALCLQVADNQRFTGALAVQRGYAIVADARRASDGEIIGLLSSLIHDPVKRAAMSEAGHHAVDGLGSNRIAKIIAGESSGPES